MKKRNALFIIGFLAPSLICFLAFFLYPILRTVLMSFFDVKSIGDAFSLWTFVGLDNFKHMFTTQLSQIAFINIGKIWLYGGLITFVAALLYAVILASGVKFKRFFRSMIYLPNIISVVAMANMWLQYVYNNKFGLLTSFFSAIGAQNLARIQWTSSEMLFTSLLIAYCFGAIGYFMLILLAGIERIPKDLYESAVQDGASAFRQFTAITLPLIRNVMRTCVMLWTISTVNFFAWGKMFSMTTSPQTVTPVVYMYDLVFGGSAIGANVPRVGVGAAVGVTLALAVVVVSVFMNVVFAERRYEY